jgi:cell wall-associated NlpC family hydrolase
VIKAAAGGLAALVVGVVLVAAATGGVAAQFLGDPGGSDGGVQSTPSATALGDIPPDYLLLYMQAARTCPGLDWTVLAGIGSVESDHGQSTLPGVRSGLNAAGLAAGPMQFEAATFAAYDQPVPDGGADPPSPYDPADAIYAAARMLCANGARDNANVTAAIYSYNHADWYVAEVLDRAATYAATVIDTGAAPSSVAQEAISYVEGQLGLPYEWDGSGPAHGDAGFDCSGLTQAAYQAAGISLPHNAAQQYAVTPHVPPGQPLEPGDLVFFGTSPATIHHVGLYLGGGQMIDAPDYGIPVRIESYKESDYYGASRPTATDTAAS